jgi:hypothetical protein
MAGNDFIKTFTTEPPIKGEEGKAVTGTDFPGNKRGLDVSIAGGTAQFTPSGLTIGGLITRVTINNTGWTALPATPLTDRNTIAVQNKSVGEIYINFDNSAAVADSWLVTAGGSVSYGITESIVLYARSAAASADVIVKELA